ncbi:TIGR00730 family Rossman fold protein [Corynebacterium ammoniagenes]|nr:TIGR00730 family Rossman fold protein [Corynebacterium ammoniagenes]APT81557.1 DNA-binding protein [Corynebacterium ammoniagenes DSM 20306]AQS74687.1 Rossman fold protein, TIGR00730 family [Corynebacterium ammoniagenes]
MKSVAVYCGSTLGNSPRFEQAAQQVGAELARRGLRMVYGGGNVGLMGTVADAAVAAGGEVVGVIPRQLIDREMAHAGLTELEVVDTMAQRKTRMEELADAFLCLPGGVGTLEELVEVLTMQQLGHVHGPVGLVNVDGFWQPFLQTLQSMAACGFVQQRYIDAIALSSDPAEILDEFAGWTPIGAKWA